MSQPLQVGVVGCGGIAQMMHLPHLAERPDLFHITALCDVSEATLEAVGARYGVATRTLDAAALVARDDVEAVLICASGSHREVVERALAAGKHVLVEKPLGFSLEETAALSQAADEASGLLMVGYHKRYDPAFAKALAVLAAAPSPVRYVQVTVLHPDDGDYRSHHAILPHPGAAPPSAPEEVMEQGALDAVTTGLLAPLLDGVVGEDAPAGHRVAALMGFQSLIHDTNLVRAALGEPEEVEHASCWRRGFAQSSLTRFAGGARANMSWVSVPGLKHYEETLRFVSPETRVTLTFPSPYLRHMPTPLCIERMDGGALVQEHHTVSFEEAFRAELHHFHACVKRGATLLTPARDALGDARWLTALARAYKGGAVRVEGAA